MKVAITSTGKELTSLPDHRSASCSTGPAGGWIPKYWRSDSISQRKHLKKEVIMSGFNRKGPDGEGAMSGRGFRQGQGLRKRDGSCNH